MGTQFATVPYGNPEACYHQLASPFNALRIVLTVALDRYAATVCLGEDPEDCFSLWPSSLYGLLAAEAMRSPVVWARCSRRIEQSLGVTVRQFIALPPASISQLLRDSSQILTHRELASLLWVLLLRRGPISEFMASRQGVELEVVAVHRSAAATEASTSTNALLGSNDATGATAPSFSRDGTVGAPNDQLLIAQQHLSKTIIPT
jgi:hypothetical protein